MTSLFFSYYVTLEMGQVFGSKGVAVILLWVRQDREIFVESMTKYPGGPDGGSESLGA